MNAPINENKVRVVCISDTHEKLGEMLDIIPDGDILIHAGDFTNYGDVGEVIKFNAEMGMFMFIFNWCKLRNIQSTCYIIKIYAQNVCEETLKSLA